MIPDGGRLQNGVVVARLPSYTYKTNLEDRINGYTDHLEAMKQAVYKIIFTERYAHEIYDWNYGVELADLFGKPKTYVRSELKRRITEALMADDRINGVMDFAFSDPRRNTIAVSFTVDTIFGSFEEGREVNY